MVSQEFAPLLREVDSIGTFIPMDFAKLPTWYDKLPQQERASINQLKNSLIGNDTNMRLLPIDQGIDYFAQLQAGKRIYLEKLNRAAQDGGMSFLRIGDGDCAFLGAGYFPMGSPWKKTTDRLLGSSGTDREAFYLRPEFIEAIKNCTILGVQQNWRVVCENTYIILRMLGVSVPLTHAVEVHLPYALTVDATLFESLAGRRVILVGGTADRLFKAWGNRSFREGFRHLGDMSKVNVVGHVTTTGLGQQTYKRIGLYMTQIAKHNFDVALLSCGTTAKILAYRIHKRLRKVALDVGFVFDALLGDDERKTRPEFRYVKVWPPPFKG